MSKPWGSALKGLIFEDESSGQSESAKTVQPAVQSAVPVVSATTSLPYSSTSQSQQVNPEIKAELDKAVLEANQVSYSEFVNYLKAMSSALAGMDEATRYRAAIAAAAQKLFTPEEIIRGLDAILQVIRREEQEFNTAANQRINERVGARESEVANIDRQVSDNNSKISMLQTENQQLGARKSALSEEVQAERRKIEARKSEFASTVTAEVSRYEDEKRKIVVYSGKGA